MQEALDLAEENYDNAVVYAIVADSEGSESKPIFEKMGLEAFEGRPEGIPALVDVPVVHFNLNLLNY